MVAWSFLAGLLLFSAMAAPFWAGRVYTADDLGAFHLPIRGVYAEQLARGEAFDWMPQLFCGFYLTGEGQLGGYHPLHWLLYRFLPLPAAFAWELLLSYPLMMVGTWLFLRRLLNNSPAAAAGSLWFAFCGFNLLHLVHPNAVAIIAHIPWLLWSIDVVLVDARRRRVMAATVLIALLTGSQLLLGYPQYVWFSLLIEGGYAAFVLHAQRFASRARVRSMRHLADCIGCVTATWPRLVIAQVAGLLLGGVQLVPTLDAWLHSARQAADPQFALWGSLHPANLVQLVALSIRRPRGGRQHPRVRALPRRSPLDAHCVVGGAPRRVARFQAPGSSGRRLGDPGVGDGARRERTVVSRVGLAAAFPHVSFSLPLRGVGAVFSLRAGGRRLYVIAPRASTAGRVSSLPYRPDVSQALPPDMERLQTVVALAAASGVVAVVGLTLRHETYIASIPLIVTGPALFLVAAVLVIMAARGHRAAMVGLILFAAADQGCYGLTYVAYLRNTTFDQWLASARTPPQCARWPRSGNLVGLQRARLAPRETSSPWPAGPAPTDMRAWSRAES